MKKQLILICGLLLLSSILMAASHYGFTANGFEASALNLGMGGSPIAAASYWHNDPLAAYGNPAFPSLHEGFSYSGSSFTHMELDTSEGSERLKHHAKLFGLSYNGIGLLTSLEPLDGSTYATETDYGAFSVTTEDPFEGGYTIYPKDRSNIFGLSVNLQEFTRSVLGRQEFLDSRIDLALGLNYIQNTTTVNVDAKPLDANSIDMGVLSKFALLNNYSWQVETALGASLFNAMNQTKLCYHNVSKERIYKRLNMAGSISAAMKNPGFYGSGIVGSIKNYGTLRFVAGACEEFADDPLILATGTEIGVVDMLFLRAGYHYDKAGKIQGTTWGLGLNLHYGNLFGVHYDYAMFPSGKGWPDRSMHETGVTFDFLGLLKLLRDK